MPHVFLPHYPNAWFAYILDRGAERSLEMLKAVEEVAKYQQVKNLIRFLSMHMEDKEIFVPLQAADILAYELYRLAKHLDNSGSLSPRINNLTILAEPPRHWEQLTEQRIKLIAVKAMKDAEDSLGKHRGIR
jgi:hypothetical protein